MSDWTNDRNGGLICKLRLPSKEAYDLIVERFGLADNPRVYLYPLGTLQHPTGGTVQDAQGNDVPEMADSLGYHVDILLIGQPDVPKSWWPYIVAPEYPKHGLAGREPDARAQGELAADALADLTKTILDDLVPTDQELAWLQGVGRTTDLEVATTRKELREQITSTRSNRDSLVDRRTVINTEMTALREERNEKNTQIAIDRAARDAMINGPEKTNATEELQKLIALRDEVVEKINLLTTERTSLVDDISSANASLLELRAKRLELST